MIKTSPRRQNPNLFASLSSLQSSKHFRNSVQLTPLVIQSTHQRQISYPSSTIIVDSTEFQKLKQILQWRHNTEFPIVKIRSYKLSNEKQNPQHNLVEILVELQSKNKSLSEMDKLPFFQAIYVLKEAMIGFQRLCHHFGFFTPTIEMIKFNDHQNCKVWINEDCFSNVTNLGSVKSQNQFVYELCQIVENKTIKSRTSMDFFNKIKSSKYFFQAICSIDIYAKSNRIIIPTRIQNLQESKSPLLKTSLTSKPIFKQNKKIMRKQTKVPEFIMKNKVKKTISFDINTPIPRKMTACTEQILRDHSLTNITRNNSSNSFLKNEFSQKKIRKSEEDHIQEDSFLKEMNIKITQPNKNQKINNIPSAPNLKYSFYENTPDSPSSPFGQVSEIFYHEQKRSRFSIFNSPSHEQISPFQTAQKLFLTVHKPTNNDDTYSTSPKKKYPLSPRCIKTLQYLDEQESFDEYEKQQKVENKFQPLSISEFREKRKFSEDCFNFQSRINTQNNIKDTNFSSIAQHRTQNFLNIPKNFDDFSNIRKSPSHKVISTPQKIKEAEEDERQTAQKEYLRDTIMSKNGWKGLGLFANKQSIKQSFVDDQQIPNVQSKTSDLPKLGGMGRIVKSSMIAETEFQLQYGDKLQKEQFVRDQVMNILN